MRPKGPDPQHWLQSRPIKEAVSRDTEELEGCLICIVFSCVFWHPLQAGSWIQYILFSCFMCVYILYIHRLLSAVDGPTTQAKVGN
jgi:hypothetical protein